VGGVHSGQELGGVHTVEQPGVDRTRLGEAREEGCHLAPGGVVVGAVSVVGGWVAAAGYPVILHPLDVAPEQVVLGDVRERGCGVGGAGAQHRDRRDRGDEDQRSSPVAWWLSHSGLSLHVVPSPPDLAGEYRGRSIPDHHPARGSNEESAESRRGGAVESCRRCAGIESSAHSRHYRCEEGEGPETQDWSMSRRLLLVATVVAVAMREGHRRLRRRRPGPATGYPRDEPRLTAVPAGTAFLPRARSSRLAGWSWR